MKKITAGKWILSGLLLAAVVSVLICRHRDGHEIQSAAFLSSRDGFLYGMDITDDFYYLFRTDEAPATAGWSAYPGFRETAQ